jgi:hypothetical protein
MAQQHLTERVNVSPPNSPHLNQTNENVNSMNNEYDLQVDYWAYTSGSTPLTGSTQAPVVCSSAANSPASLSTQMTHIMHQANLSPNLSNPTSGGSTSLSQANPKISKTIIKALFKRLQIHQQIPSYQLMQCNQESTMVPHSLSASYSIKEKKQKSNILLCPTCTHKNI